MAKDQKLLKPKSDDEEEISKDIKKNNKDDIDDFKKSILAKQEIQDKKKQQQQKQKQKEQEEEEKQEQEDINPQFDNEENLESELSQKEEKEKEKPNPQFANISEETKLKAARLKEKVREFFYFAYNNYLEKAFPLDELKPLSCGGVSKFGGVYLTLIDCMDTVAILGNKTEFRRIVKLLIKEVKNFEFDKSVSVFETNIRVVGGLLAGHMLASDPTKNFVPGYKGELLGLALDMAERLYLAFDTPTGVNYGAINLKYGVSPSESRITCSACAGTFALEFGLLTKLTGDPKWDKTAKNALKKIWGVRNTGSGGLMGNHIGIDNLSWMFGPPTGIGGHMDSAYEYMFKAGYMFKDEDYQNMWKEAKKQIITSLYNRDLKMFFNFGTNQFPSLAAFFPGVLALDNETDIALDNLKAIMKVWNELGALPELSVIGSGHAQIGSEGWPLRPEFPESLYHAFKVTKQEYLIDFGEKVLNTIEKTKSKCGFASIRTVSNFGLDDIMDSFFLAETLKYLYLLFDLDNFVTKGDYTFNTEAHLLPVFEIKEAHISNFPHLKKKYNLK